MNFEKGFKFEYVNKPGKIFTVVPVENSSSLHVKWEGEESGAFYSKESVAWYVKSGIWKVIDEEKPKVKIRVVTDIYEYMGLNKGAIIVNAEYEFYRGVHWYSFKVNGKDWELTSSEVEEISVSDETDPTNPDYYKTGGIECIDYLKAKLSKEEYRGYLRGNIIKYSSRLGGKDESVKELGKIVWYAEKLKSDIEERK